MNGQDKVRNWRGNLGLLAAVALAFTASAARIVEVPVWRGETHTRILHDHVRLGPAPAGLEVKAGVAQEVRYLDRQFGTHYQSFADRVVWGSQAVGVKVLSVTAAADLPAGEYRCGDLCVKVLDRVLPPAKEWRYFLDLWQHPWAVARWHQVEPFSPAHYAAMRPLWEMLAAAGNKTLTVTLLDRPWNQQCYDAYHSMIRHVRGADGKWRFDYRIFDEYVEFGRSCGLGQHISCYTMCPWDYEVRWEDEAGDWHAAKAVPGSEAFKEYWGDFLTDFAAHLKAKGWFADTYIALDERSPEDVFNIVRFINAKAPGLKVAFAGADMPSRYEGITIDNCCVALHHLKPGAEKEAAARRAAGLLTTYYVCCNPDCPNTFCDSEIEEAFWLGAYPAFGGVDGFLRWAWNSWPQDPIHDASYTGILTGWKAGDTFLVYPDGSPSLRFLELKNGIVAAEKVRILRNEGRLTAELKALAAKYERGSALKRKTDFAAVRAATLKLVNE